MSNSTIPVNIRILDKEYKISCPEGEHESLLVSVKHVSDNMQKIRESGKALGAERVAVMAAINIAHEMLATQNNESNNVELSAHVDAIQHLVDSTLKTHR